MTESKKKVFYASPYMDRYAYLGTYFSAPVKKKTLYALRDYQQTQEA